MTTLRDTAIVVLIASGLMLALEGAVRIAAPQDTVLRAEAGQPMAIEDPILGHRLRAGIVAEHRSPEFEARYHVGAEGRRIAPGAAAPRAADARRVLILGDSFTFGIGVPQAAIFPTVLEAALRASRHDVAVINAGVPGYDTRAEVRLLEERWGELAPDLVVLTLLPNDLFTNTPDTAAIPTGAVVRTEEKAAPRLHAVLLAQRVLLQADWLYCALYRRTERAAFFQDPPAPKVAAQIEVTRDWLARAQAFSEARGVPMIVLSIPQQVQVLTAAGSCPAGTFDAGAPDRLLRAHAEALGLSWVASLDTLAHVYRHGEEPLYFRYDGHLTAAGHRVVGHYLAERIKQIVEPIQP